MHGIARFCPITRKVDTSKISISWNCIIQAGQSVFVKTSAKLMNTGVPNSVKNKEFSFFFCNPGSFLNCHKDQSVQ